MPRQPSRQCYDNEMLRHVSVVLALVGCSSHRAPPPAPAARYPIVPDAVMSQLGDVGFVLAVDLHTLDLTSVSAMIPDAFSCARDIARSAKMAVITAGVPDTWEGRITGIAEASSRNCAVAIANGVGIAVTPAGDHGATLDAPGTAISLLWHSDELLVAQKGAQIRSGGPPGVITDLLAPVPRHVQGWLVTSGMPAYKIKSVTAWLEATSSAWKFTAIAESTESNAARPWAENIVGGFTSAAAAKQISVDASWFAIESTPTTAKLIATIPLAAFVPAHTTP